MTGCIESDTQLSEAICTTCTEEMAPNKDANGCETCEGVYWSDGGKRCVYIEGCTIGGGGSYPQCFTCNPGFRLKETDEGTVCELCPSGTFSVDGYSCETIDYCLDSPLGLSSPGCLKCESGFGLNSEGSCDECVGNMWSSGEDSCQPGNDDCVDSYHTSPKCFQCKEGMEPSGDEGACVKCEDGFYSEDGTACQPVTSVDGCISYSKIKDTCLKCTDNLPLGYDNTCRACENGEYFTGVYCVRCNKGEFSIAGEACTSECDKLSASKEACEGSGFCKMSLGSCVDLDADDGTFIIVIVVCVICVVIIVAVILILLWKNGWFTSSKKWAKMVRDTDMALIDGQELDVVINQTMLAFGDAPPPVDHTVSEYVSIQNLENVQLHFTVTVPSGANFAVKAKPATGVLENKGSEDIKLMFKRIANEVVQDVVTITVFDPNNSTNKKVFTLPVSVAERASYDLALSDLQIGDVIRETNSYTVYRGVFNRKDVSIKKLEKKTEKNIQRFQLEVEVLKQVQGRNIITFFGSILAEGEYCHVTEYMDLGTLENVFETHQLDDAIKTKIVLDVGRGMALLHSFKVVHRGLMPENVLCKAPLDVNNENMCKITEFGTSTITHENVLTKAKGDDMLPYMAPEVLRGERFRKSADVYSYGILMAVVWNDGMEPYRRKHYDNPEHLRDAILSGKRPHVKNCPDSIKELMERCWSENPDERPNFGQMANA